MLPQGKPLTCVVLGGQLMQRITSGGGKPAGAAGNRNHAASLYCGPLQVTDLWRN